MKKPRTYTPPQADVEELAEAAQYVGSPEHKIGRFWGGQSSAPSRSGAPRSRPKRQLTTICPLHTEADRVKATAWVRQAILTGCFRFVEGKNRFPKHVWHVDANGQGWMGRVVNSEQGTYKGWPARPEEIDAEIRKKSRQK